MVTVRDPVGTAQERRGRPRFGVRPGRRLPGRLQRRARNGARRSSTIRCRWCRTSSSTSTTCANEGDLPYGFEPTATSSRSSSTALNLYWTFDAGGPASSSQTLTLVPVSSTDEISCADLTGAGRADGGRVSVDERGVLRRAVRRGAVQRPDRGPRRLRRRLPLATGWAEEAQILLGSPLTGEPRALANDCLVGAWTADMLPGRELRPEEGESRGLVLAGRPRRGGAGGDHDRRSRLRRRPNRQRVREDR